MPLPVSIFYILGITTFLIDQKIVLNIMCISNTKIIWSIEDGLSPGKVRQSWGKGRAWRDLVFWNLFLRLKLAFLGWMFHDPSLALFLCFRVYRSGSSHGVSLSRKLTACPLGRSQEIRNSGVMQFRSSGVLVVVQNAGKQPRAPEFRRSGVY